MKSAYHLLFKENMESIFHHFSNCFDIRMAFLNKEFLEIVPEYSKPLSEYCLYIQNNLGKKKQCELNDQHYCDLAKKNGSMTYYECHAGLKEAIHPIFIDDVHIGYFIIGQFRSQKRLMKYLSNNKNKSREQLDLFLKVPYYPESKIENILGLFEIIVEYILKTKSVTFRQNLLVEKIVLYLEEHLEDDISLTDIAEIFNKSSSTVSHMLSRITGKSFKQIITQFRIEKSKALFFKYPEMTIAEIAEKSGINDPFYFSRIFKKNTGRSPVLWKQENLGGK